jgi:ferredoxin
MNGGIPVDPSLVHEVRKYGDFDVSGCFNCGSCTVSCALSNEGPAFPRRSMRYVNLGLRESLRSSLEPWLCYDCGDCSTTCPRQAEPAQAMMTLRRYLTAQYDWTGLSSRIHRSALWGIGTHLLIGAAVLSLVLFYHLYVVGLPLPQFVSIPLGVGHMFPTITVFTLAVVFIPLFILLASAFRMYWLTMHRGNTVSIPFRLYLAEAGTFILHAFTQVRFRECTEKSRWIKHAVLVSGCVLMFVLLVFFLKWFQTDELYPIYHPQRWLGYLATGALIYATGDILLGRLKKRDEAHKFSDRSDWILPIMLLLTAVTGIAIHIFRYSGFSFVAHFTYALHLAVAVPMLVIEIPFGKWSHMMYRPLAVYFQNVKEKALQLQISQEPGSADVEGIRSAA